MNINRKKAIDWANERIADPNFSTEPIRVNAWELIHNPKLFLETCVARLTHGSEREKRVVYNRVRNLKMYYNDIQR
ncbi:MAG: hypothetical protein RI965_1776 [Bacteroidota bacterium]|jgi:hypothetical protein